MYALVALLFAVIVPAIAQNASKELEYINNVFLPLLLGRPATSFACNCAMPNLWTRCTLADDPLQAVKLICGPQGHVRGFEAAKLSLSMGGRLSSDWDKAMPHLETLILPEGSEDGGGVLAGGELPANAPPALGEFSLVGQPNVGGEMWEETVRLASLRLENTGIGGELRLRNHPAMQRLFVVQCPRIEVPLQSGDVVHSDLLQTLVVRGTASSGALLDGWPQVFPSLALLDLSRNKYVGTVPATAPQLPELRLLNLTLNALSGPLPATFMRPANDDAQCHVFDLVESECGVVVAKATPAPTPDPPRNLAQAAQRLLDRSTPQTLIVYVSVPLALCMCFCIVCLVLAIRRRQRRGRSAPAAEARTVDARTAQQRRSGNSSRGRSRQRSRSNTNDRTSEGAASAASSGGGMRPPGGFGNRLPSLQKLRAAGGGGGGGGGGGNFNRGHEMAGAVRLRAIPEGPSGDRRQPPPTSVTQYERGPIPAFSESNRASQLAASARGSQGRPMPPAARLSDAAVVRARSQGRPLLQPAETPAAPTDHYRRMSFGPGGAPPTPDDGTIYSGLRARAHTPAPPDSEYAELSLAPASPERTSAAPQAPLPGGYSVVIRSI